MIVLRKFLSNERLNFLDGLRGEIFVEQLRLPLFREFDVFICFFLRSEFRNGVIGRATAEIFGTFDRINELVANFRQGILLENIAKHFVVGANHALAKPVWFNFQKSRVSYAINSAQIQQPLENRRSPFFQNIRARPFAKFS